MTFGRPLRHSAALAAAATCMLVISACGSQQSGGAGSGTRTAEPSAAKVAAPPKGVRVVAIGDIACPPGSKVTATTCQHAATAELTEGLNPSVVLGLGDLQYPKASLADLRGSYDKSWGRLLSRTRPIPGNHEYSTPGAAGYYSYFKGRQPGSPGYYRVNVGGWRLYMLNSNCSKISCSKQAAWLEKWMKAYPAKCTLVTMHHPRYSSGPHGNNTSVKALWSVAYKYRNDLVLAGHDHDYEWFTRMDASGYARSNGMQSFVVGTGGKELYRLGARKPGSRFAQASKHGVLSLDLQPGRFDWAYHAIDGTVLDQGSRPCV